MKKECPLCNREFEIDKNSRYQKKFCSRSCANKRVHSKKTKDKIRSSLKTERLRNCQYCGKEFSMHDRRGKYCSQQCVSEKRREHLPAFRKYKLQCKFNFDLKDYPNRFDFSLIEKHGWYSAANRGNNLNGVSRDHMVSVKYGFENNIPPEIISHPANCKLLLHSENASKHKDCTITIEELYERIKNW